MTERFVDRIASIIEDNERSKDKFLRDRSMDVIIPYLYESKQITQEDYENGY